MNYDLLQMMEDASRTESGADREAKGTGKYANKKNQCMKLYVV